MDAKGRVHKFGDDIDTDIIIPAIYLNTTDYGELAKHCMEPLDDKFSEHISQGDIMVAGDNFGCGSSREHAPAAIKAAGISCVIAKSFARIFYRNSINIGLPILECPEASEAIADGDELEVDYSTGEIRNLSRGESYTAAPFPEFIRRIIDCGGLLNSIKEN